MSRYDLTERDGKTLDHLTDAALQHAERRLGYPLTITQGSYNAGKVAASAGTHDGGGVVDLLAWDWHRKVIALREVGFAAWYRPAIPGLWPAHIHAVLIGHQRLSDAANRQVVDYLQRRNGLKDHAPDTDPGWTGTARFSWDAHVADQTLRGELWDARQAAGKARRTGLRDRLTRIWSRTGFPTRRSR